MPYEATLNRTLATLAQISDAARDAGDAKRLLEAEDKMWALMLAWVVSS